MLEDKSDRKTPFDRIILESIKLQVESEKKINENVLSIRLSSDGLIIHDNSPLNTSDDLTYTIDKLSGVYCQGIQYYDLSEVHFINNMGMAILIDLLKSLLEMGVEVQFANVDEKIKKKIKEMGLENIIHCSEK